MRNFYKLKVPYGSWIFLYNVCQQTLRSPSFLGEFAQRLNHQEMNLYATEEELMLLILSMGNFEYEHIK